jgi:25S rRNA (uracil2843-N3)-methyltransferase
MALQSIKQAFYIRDYVSIFTTPSNLPVYTAAYIPGRALCYYEIFRSHTQLLRLLAKSSRIYLPGSGSGSELIGMSAAMLHVPPARQHVQLFMQDIGDWSEVLDRLEESVRHQWKLDSNQLHCSYEQGDVLEPSPRRDQLIQEADLITFMFVMNELFVNKAKSMALIQSLVSNMKKGAYLLVVDSAGSFSHLKIGDQTYMIYTLLDAIKSLDKVISEDSKWYRYVDGHASYFLKRIIIKSQLYNVGIQDTFNTH